MPSYREKRQIRDDNDRDIKIIVVTISKIYIERQSCISGRANKIETPGVRIEENDTSCIITQCLRERVPLHNNNTKKN